MSKKMLIDATHEEETRVAVVDGSRLVEFDYESKVRKQLKGNIFLAKVTRVEPSLQAAFVNFGGNRHGFLPFSEIHPDYYRIPVADRERILAEQAEEISALQEEEELEESDEEETESSAPDEEELEEEDILEEIGGDTLPVIEKKADDDKEISQEDENRTERPHEIIDIDEERLADTDHDTEAEISHDETVAEETYSTGELKESSTQKGKSSSNKNKEDHGRDRKNLPHRSRKVEVVGGDDFDSDRPRRANRRHYKIQEVIKRGQIMLVQVSKEERGNKGAAVTTYLSLPGRYCVLMPNSPGAGGISRKIGNFRDRRHMKEMLKSLDVPEGMSVILRTAGVSRTKTEIKRDLDYLTRLWDNIRELTLKSTAPALVNEEGNLIKRSIRDIYTRDIEEIVVAGSNGYKVAKRFMKMLIPSHAQRVQEYKDEKLPLFQRYRVENQINEIAEPAVTLKSGGYLVINPTEALVSIDVNSGRSTKERHIEETALKTNLEAADEVARQLKLRDLGGLVVIDFIDMEDRRNNGKVERRIKEALSRDRARIQIGRISSFGLLELSRQRMNPSLTESQFHKCPYCQGVGFVRTLDGTAIAAIRSIEEIGTYGRYAEVILKIPYDVAIYILNHKRSMLASMEHCYDFKVVIQTDNSILPGKYTVEPGAQKSEDSHQEDTSEEEMPQYLESGTSEISDDTDRKGSRRRGRRGGKRRSRPESAKDGNTKARDKDTKLDADEDSSNQTDVKVDAENKETSEKKSRKSPGQKTTRRKESDKSSKEKQSQKNAATEQNPSSESTENRKAAHKKTTGEKIRRGKKSDPKTVSEEDTGKNAATNDAYSENNAHEVEADSGKTSSVSSEAPESKHSSSREYEIVDHPTENKKKGWWNKLIES
jgi:ribonuclease E